MEPPVPEKPSHALPKLLLVVPQVQLRPPVLLGKSCPCLQERMARVVGVKPLATPQAANGPVAILLASTGSQVREDKLTTPVEVVNPG